MSEEKIKDYSFGVIPVLKKDNGEHLFLLLQALNSKNWGFPKGHPEGNETDLEAALRELSEEARISKVRLIESLKYSENYTTEKHGQVLDKTVEYFVGYVENNAVQIQAKEILDFKWVSYEEAMRMFVYENPKRILTQVVEDLSKISPL